MLLKIEVQIYKFFILCQLNFYQFLKTNLISLRSKIRILSEIFIPKHKHNISVKKFIKNRFGSEFEKVFIEPFLTGVYAGETDKMSAKHVLSKIWNLEQNKTKSISLPTRCSYR